MAGAGKSASKGSGERLKKETVLQLLDQMKDDLSRHQRERLDGLAALIDDEGRIGLERALDVATSGGDDQQRQATFRKFRAAVAQAATAAHVSLTLEVDALRRAPVHRFCWFEGTNPVLGELEEMSKDKSRHRGRPMAWWPPGFQKCCHPVRSACMSAPRVDRRPGAGQQGQGVHSVAPARPAHRAVP